MSCGAPDGLPEVLRGHAYGGPHHAQPAGDLGARCRGAEGYQAISLKDIKFAVCFLLKIMNIVKTAPIDALRANEVFVNMPNCRNRGKILKFRHFEIF